MAPRKRTYRRRRPYGYRRRRRYYRRRNNRNRVYTVKSRIPTGIPDRMMVKLKYSEVINLSDGIGGVPQYYSFRGNSIYDPDYTSGSTVDKQPTGRDEWAQFYNYYKVNASKCQVQCLNLNTTTANSTVLVTLNPSITNMTSFVPTAQINTLPYCKYVTMAPSSGGGNPRSMSNYMSTKKMYGIKELDDDNFRPSMVNNPSNVWFWNISANNINTTASSFSLIVLVTITYYVEFSERAVLPPS